MAHYYIDNQTSAGYVVAQLDTSGLDDGYLSNRYVRNFGDRQSDHPYWLCYGSQTRRSAKVEENARERGFKIVEGED